MDSVREIVDAQSRVGTGRPKLEEMDSSGSLLEANYRENLVLGSNLRQMSQSSGWLTVIRIKRSLLN